ncbi:MAG: hypothetical protein COA96_01925 [SAR86 cluster bacterium]|uniref:Zinc-ribbon domain-containing protein n=1 Tax=SAR86 cluster bacterium TaxID=2030880 RepID=A0A2A5B907_9GAMM|nr:MAG: hypothetical protein COA96_01925 [SAR86 cluster bacterium]
MKNFTCSCGQPLFFENTQCLSCERQLGFDPVTLSMYSFSDENPHFSGSTPLKLCKNSADYGVCNWFVTDPKSSYCLSCGLNHTIPNLLEKKRRRWWKNLEHAKRRLIYSLLVLNLPVEGRANDPHGLAFSFIEDKRTNPRVSEEYVATGHLNGLITVNTAEADKVNREISRAYTGELYRTLLGHFRHESGHYYFDKLICSEELRYQFREFFGDERADYSAALKYYYANKKTMTHDPAMISRYAQSHPLEDWAEVWAHYLHMVDTLDTAAAYDQELGSSHLDDIDETLSKWSRLTIVLNALNRSMGLEDAYPFVLSALTLKKLRFVHGLIYPS